jgi:FixJ family two-component response regulator
MSNKPMVSVVDDDAFARHATENLLLSLGLRVTTFASAEEFLESGGVDDTSCLITDVRMPGLTGFDLQQRLIDEGKPLPVIFITAFFSETIRAKALAAGAVGCLGKPYGEAHLIECLNKALVGRASPALES